MFTSNSNMDAPCIKKEELFGKKFTVMDYEFQPQHEFDNGDKVDQVKMTIEVNDELRTYYGQPGIFRSFKDAEEANVTVVGRVCEIYTYKTKNKRDAVDIRFAE